MDNDPWFVILTTPQQQFKAVERLHDQGRELYVPWIAKRVPSGRIGKNGQKITRLIGKPLFQGYGFIRSTGILDMTKIREVYGVSDFFRVLGRPVLLPHEAVMAIRQKQYELQSIENQKVTKRKSKFKLGDRVRVDEAGGVYAGMVATIDKIDSQGRLGVLFGMIRYTLPADKVVAA
jgi:transcription antitermination factor NusG